MKKKGQSWSLETYLAISMFLIAIIFFYGLITTEETSTTVDIEVERVGRLMMNSEWLADGQITEDELEAMLGMNCTTLKQKFGTNKEICLYMKDSQGKIFENGTHHIFGIGCEGIVISDQECGSYVES